MSNQSTLLELKSVENALQRKRIYQSYLFYKPYPKQLAFHNAPHKERMMFAGNQLGKTLAAGMEVAYHATGNYPAWWQGKRYDKSLVIWVAGVSREGVRDGAQRILMGQIGATGTGSIPHNCILDIAWEQHDKMDFAKIKNKHGITIISFKSYDQGREKFQAAGVDLMWFDEEPPEDIYTEGYTRTIAVKGQVIMTFTPLQGISGVVKRYLYEKSENRFHITMTIDDVKHFTSEERKIVIDGYKPHEREARIYGIPTFGPGKVFPIEESLVFMPPIHLPNYIPRIGGLDFGFTHNFAGVQLAFDRDKDIIYLEREFAAKEQTPQQHCMVLRHWGDLIFAWPHDGNKRDIENKAVITLANKYRKEGLSLTKSHATFPDGGISVDAGISEMLERMQTGRFKVFNTCVGFLEEFRLYHRDEHARLVKIDEDRISAARIAMMMRRYATALGRRNLWNTYQPSIAEGTNTVNM